MAAAVDKSRVPWWVSNLIVPLVNLILASIHYFWGHYKFEYAQFLIEDEGLEDIL